MIYVGCWKNGYKIINPCVMYQLQMSSVDFVSNKNIENESKYWFPLPINTTLVDEDLAKFMRDKKTSSSLQTHFCFLFYDRLHFFVFFFVCDNK